MFSWIFIFLMVPYSFGIQMRETEYECGAHGRFEYCIDGVAGCVIGCHCHPGYYFDTDTKICEPNIRLSQNFRRNYDVEPTRIFIPPTPPATNEPATTLRNAVDEKIDIITKDADDLGDWLYNQFFKTIENQVINETKDDTIITRRSESVPSFVRKPTRRSHKYWRSRRKKKKKKKGLRNKLLRITEDDSLFDSASSSTSDESSDSSSSSAASEEESHEKPRRKKLKNDHGHKKIVVFNKRPKPPLPSFIFLPNMETPFFPPIGLPPPPIPMYPMVPVPPMMGPFPFPAATPACDTNTKKNGNEGTQPPQTDKTPALASEKPSNNKPSDDQPAGDSPLDEKPSEDNPADDKPTDDKPADDTPPNDNPADDKPPDENPTDNSPPSILRSRTKKRRGPRNKLVQRLRQKLKRKNKLQNYLANEYDGPPQAPPGFIANHLPNLRQRPLPEINVEEELAGLEDVDFKYLSQLIHRVDLNKTNQSPPTTTAATQMKNMLTVPPLSRRNYYDNYPDHITKVLGDLVNQPMDHIPDDQLSDVFPNKPYNVPNQPTYNVPNQPTFNAPKQLPYNAPNQPTYNVPNQLSYNVPNQSTYNVPNQPSYNALNQPFYKVLNQSTYNVPNQPTYNIPNQSTYTVANQPTNNVLNQPKYNVPNQLTYNVLNQPKYSVPNQPAYNLVNQPTHVSISQSLQKKPYRKRIEDPNEVYFANLGRQIASMIRNVDGDKEVDIEIKSSSNIPNNPVLAGHSGSRSYWERSVRSPYKQIMNSNRKESNNLKFSNENLFSLENKVEIAASTKRTLSLHELENIISKMQKAKSKFILRNKSSHNATKSSKSSFNVNLLPGNDHEYHSIRKHNKRAQNIILHKLIEPNYVENSANTEIPKFNVSSTLQPPQIKSSLLSDFTLKASYDILNETAPKTNTYQINTYVSNIIATKKPNPEAVPQYIYKMPSQYFKSYAYTVLPLPQKQPLFANINMGLPYMQPTTSRTSYQQLSPMVLKHKSVKYFRRINNNQYLNEKASMSLSPRYLSSRITPVGSRYETYGKRYKPSYFHQAIHNFDNFDDLL